MHRTQVLFRLNAFENFVEIYTIISFFNLAKNAIGVIFQEMKFSVFIGKVKIEFRVNEGFYKTTKIQ